MRKNLFATLLVVCLVSQSLCIFGRMFKSKKSSETPTNQSAKGMMATPYGGLSSSDPIMPYVNFIASLTPQQKKIPRAVRMSQRIERYKAYSSEIAKIQQSMKTSTAT
jgi:hypothetical protein